jgi:sterol desaturase/sphingolipid hydroxylase (fatty acid hydroxylase superfamily)
MGVLDTAGIDAVTSTLGLGAAVGLAIKLFVGRLWLLGGIAIVFVPLERLIPFRRGQRLIRKNLWTDFIHAFLGGIFIVLFIRVTYLLLPTVMGWTSMYESPLSAKHLPGWAQFLLFEAGWTFLGYWVHRFEHAWGPLWRLHSIHESNQELDWLSAFRLHWLEPALFHVTTIIPLWLFQISAPAVVAYTVFAYVTAHIQHSNIIFPMGPLKYVFPSPMFHRWHHASDPVKGGQGTSNYSEYPLWDWMFGTLHLPKEAPTQYGNAPDVPTDVLAQLAYPFGWHEAVLRWERTFWERFPLREPVLGLAARLAPLHDGFEHQLQRLCLLRTSDPVERGAEKAPPAFA